MRYIKHAVASAAVAAMCLVAASSAAGAPAPGYERFTDCPDKSVDAGVINCFVSVVDGGNLKLGSKNTPITDPIRLVGGLRQNADLGLVLGSFDGGRQQIPGGLTGMTGLDWLSWLFPFNLLALHAEAELAGNPGNPLSPVFTLPLKIRLENPLLTSNCYIGSNSSPVTLNLIHGTTNPPAPNTPITGQDPTIGFNPALGILEFNDSVLVDNSFSVPGASGCGLLNLGLIDALVNSQAGLPSAAGNNEARQSGDASLTQVTNVYPPDGLD